MLWAKTLNTKQLPANIGATTLETNIVIVF